jgi:glucose-6-phosphate 1-dehydrogenase
MRLFCPAVDSTVDRGSNTATMAEQNGSELSKELLRKLFSDSGERMTFAGLPLSVDNIRWDGGPFLVRG